MPGEAGGVRELSPLDECPNGFVLTPRDDVAYHTWIENTGRCFFCGCYASSPFPWQQDFGIVDEIEASGLLAG
jgi:hypothetical protein